MNAVNSCPLCNTLSRNNVCVAQLKFLFPGKTDEVYKELISAMESNDIETLENQTLFLGQVAHESGDLKHSVELASGAKYEGRKDLGNHTTGDGVKFKGRGYMQLTGRKNYTLLTTDLNDPEILNDPSLVATKYPATSAAWWWKTNKLSSIDSLDETSVFRVSKRVNGFVGTQEEFYEAANKGKSDAFKERVYNQTCENDYIKKLKTEKLKKYTTEAEAELRKKIKNNPTKAQERRIKQQSELNAKNRIKKEAKEKLLTDKKNKEIDPEIEKHAKDRSKELHDHLIKQTDRIHRTKKVQEVLRNQDLCRQKILAPYTPKNEITSTIS
jgi:predicted chitinase